MPTLLISLGTSPAIVPEAYWFPGSAFDAVHVLTTDSTDVTFVQQWFATEAAQVDLTITRVDGFRDFTSEDNHFQFEEVLYRWMLEKAGGVPAHICLSGGFKTMSAAVQKAAAVLGAAEVFHVLCDLPQAQQPKTAIEIEAAKSANHLHWIKLGEESGWPQLRWAKAADYPLITTQTEGCVSWVSVPDQAFRIRLQEIVERSHNVAGAWEQLRSLPFSILATWSSTGLAWLNQPVDHVADRDWVAALPKVEMHCHLGGFATHGAALEAVRAAADDPSSLPVCEEPAVPAGWPVPASNIPLESYMRLGDANGSALLRDPGCLRRQCELLYDHLLEQNVVYAEIRCSPANYATAQRSPWAVLADIKTSFDRSMAASPQCHVNLIIIATRKDKGDYRAAISRHLALAVSAAEHWSAKQECRVVGVDLAGYEEEKTRAHYFREEFTGIHRCGLALTVHAGENDDAEGIWRAVFDLSARRLGHALHLVESPELMQSVANRGIGVEMCPYANYQIKGFQLVPQPEGEKTRPEYPLKRYLDAGIRVTVNTDNIGISSASLTENILLAAKMCPSLTRMDLLQLTANGLESAFISPQERAILHSRLEQLLSLP